VKVREINQRERGIIGKLNEEFGIDIFDILKGKRILITGRREVSAVAPDAYKTLKSMKRDPYSAGLHIGKIKKEKFDLGLEGAAIIAPHSRKLVTLNKKQEQLVLYGGDVRSKSAIKKSGLPDGERCFLVNENRENIAIGRIESDNIINVRDRGHYLRSKR
jgi:ribosome biogenesis protein Nip4